MSAMFVLCLLSVCHRSAAFQGVVMEILIIWKNIVTIQWCHPAPKKTHVTKVTSDPTV